MMLLRYIFFVFCFLLVGSTQASNLPFGGSCGDGTIQYRYNNLQEEVEEQCDNGFYNGKTVRQEGVMCKSNCEAQTTAFCGVDIGANGTATAHEYGGNVGTQSSYFCQATCSVSWSCNGGSTLTISDFNGSCAEDWLQLTLAGACCSDGNIKDKGGNCVNGGTSCVPLRRNKAPAQYACDGQIIKKVQVNQCNSNTQLGDTVATCAGTAQSKCVDGSATCDTSTCNGSVGGNCNASSPPTNGSCTAYPDCNPTCNAGFSYNGSSCVANNTVYACNLDGDRTALASSSCTPNYIPGQSYAPPQRVCRNSSDPAPAPADCTVCASNVGQSCTSPANTCGETNGGTYTCEGICTASTAPANRDPCNCVSNPVPGTACTSPANTCGQTNAGTIQCLGSCNAIAPPDSNCTATPQDGYCGTTYASCLSPGGFSTGPQPGIRTCFGSNGGSDQVCGSLPAPVCGDGTNPATMVATTYGQGAKPNCYPTKLWGFDSAWLMSEVESQPPWVLSHQITVSERSRTATRPT